MPTFKPIIHVPHTAQSLSIDYNNGVISQAKMTIYYSAGSFRIWLTANGGANWEEVSNGILHTFSNIGSDLRWKIQGSGTIKSIVIDDYH